ncbi:MAG: hypothetical protein IPM29_06070 [Planctomycetes bacterium]|nr:hypothetical protein [Planctomycetota bacterium]
MTCDGMQDHRPDEPDLPARVYWLVAAAAVVVMLALHWFTRSFNIPLGDAR